MKHLKKLLCGLLAAALMLCALPAAALAEGAPAQPTRTEPLDLSEVTQETDMLASEGWKWEPGETEATLTLRNCYISVNDAASAIIFPGKSGKDYHVTLVLEGANILETSSAVQGPMVTNKPSPVANMNVTIRAQAGASLHILCPVPQAAPVRMPYGFAANSITLESGDIYSNTTFCIADKNVDIRGGSLTIEANHPLAESSYYDAQDGIYSRVGNVNISGGTVSIDVGRNAIFVPGDAAQNEEQAVKITGGDVTLKAGHANNSQNCIGIAAKNIVIDTDGKVDIYGRDTALAIWKENGRAELIKAGTGFSLTQAETSPYDLIFSKSPDTTTTTIGNANYSAVDAAEAQAKALNAGDYKDFSAVTAALAAVDRNKNLLQQGEVDAMAQAILDAIAGLEKKPAPTPAPAPQAPAADAGQKANPKTGVAK
ncbi:MAG: hypothetical protein ACLVKK_07555 [Ruthenibacterium sp.]